MTDSPGPRLRIAMGIGSNAIGGAEMVMFQLADELRRRGHVLFPIGPAGLDGPMRTGWLSERFRTQGFDWYTYDLRRAVDPACVREIDALVRRLRVDLLHSHEFTLTVYGAAAARRAGVAHVATMHGCQTMMERWRRRVALRWAFRRSDAVVAVSQDTGRHLEARLGLASGWVRVIPNGIPARPGDGTAVRRELGVAERESLVVSVGNLLPRKGHRLLIEALAALSHDGGVPTWRLAVAGGGGERERLVQCASDLRVSDRVHLLGPREDIPNVLAAADVFALPSFWEGLPLALLEAMFAGKAIVASAVSGIPEAVTHERHALLTPPGDVPALSRALHRVLSDAGLRRDLGQAARERAEAQFSVRSMADAYEQLYRDVLSLRNVSGGRGPRAVA